MGVVYHGIKQLNQANLTDSKAGGERLKLDQPRLNRALGLLPLLNPVAWGLIVSDANNSNKGIWGIWTKGFPTQQILKNPLF